MRAQSEVYERWAREAEKLFRPGERVGVAVSGGADSVLLLDFMRRLAERKGLVLSAIHFNHQLRGEESEGDERFVRELACAKGLRFLHGSARVRDAARDRNLEATARELRYRYFFGLIRQGLLDKVVTAHTANDQAETLLLRLFRGAGTRGFGGIYPALNGAVVRPFLGVTRAEVEAEIARRGLEYRADSSNANRKLQRNKIRAELLPLLEREYSPEIVKLLNELSERSRDDEAFLEEKASERAQAWRVREDGAEKIPVRALGEFHPALARRALRQMIQSVRGTLRGVTYREIEALRRFAGSGQSGRSLSLGAGLVGRKDFDWLALSLPAGQRKAEFSYPVNVPGECRVREIGKIFRFKIVDPAEGGEAYNKSGLLAVDPLKLPGRMMLRNWRPGDRFQAAGRRRPEKLKELFRERRIPAEARREWPVLDSNQGIIWVRGYGSAPGKTPRKGANLVVIEESDAVEQL